MNTQSLPRSPEALIATARKEKSETLYLREYGLREIPESVRQLVHLKELNLGKNRIEFLPDWLSELSGLQSLSLHENALDSFPEVISQLMALEQLDLGRNCITTVPDSITSLTRLQYIGLNENRLSEFPVPLFSIRELNSIFIYDNMIEHLPDGIGELSALTHLSIGGNKLTALPASFGKLRSLNSLFLGKGGDDDATGNPLGTLPEVIRGLDNLVLLRINNCSLSVLPDWIGRLARLRRLYAENNQLCDLPASLAELPLSDLQLSNNLLDPELEAAYSEGIDSLQRYLRSRAEAQAELNEAKLILVGEGEVGKSCLLAALRGDEWVEGRPTTHGIEIKPVSVVDPVTDRRITLNGWDFGGQRVYRPTHQLFFSAPAVYLVVWKPREGPQQGFVKEWIKLVKHREPDAKILVVATHGGPGQRQPDVDRQELWDLFGRDTVCDFFWVESKPDSETGERRGIDRLKEAIARLASSLPEMGRAVPASWQRAREALQRSGAAYLPFERVIEICREHKIEGADATLFVNISHRLGHLIHYEHDSALRDIVVLKPDWLATAISFVLDDKQTRDSHGLVTFARLSHLWNDPAREEEFRYPPELHAVFLRLMERFDLSYRVAGLPDDERTGGTSLVAQLVPDVRPDPMPGWTAGITAGDEQQVQICRIVEAGSGQSAPAEGLFYQLIVRLHRYSLGRVNYAESVHWQRGLVLDDYFNGRALLEHLGNDVRITVRAPYPERFLSALTYEVKWLVETFWTGLLCDVMVPCLNPCGRGMPGTGLFDVDKLIDSKKRQRPEYPCPVCKEWQNIDSLLRNAPAAQRPPAKELFAEFAEVKSEVRGVRSLLLANQSESVRRFDVLDVNIQRLLSQADDAYSGLMRALLDEAREGPRLFSFHPVDPGFFERPKWISQKFRLTLWCEHSRMPLPALNGTGDSRGMYDLNLPREWFVRAAPFLKLLTGTLSLVLPVASSATKVVLDEASYKGIEAELDLGQKSIESVIGGGSKVESWLSRSDAPDLELGEAVQAHGAILRQLHAWLKEEDPGFGGLVRVRNKRQEFLWVHSQFEKEY